MHAKKSLTGGHSWHPSLSRSISEVIMLEGKNKQTSYGWSKMILEVKTCAAHVKWGRRKGILRWEFSTAKRDHRDMLWKLNMISWWKYYKWEIKAGLFKFCGGKNSTLREVDRESKSWADSSYCSPANEAEAQGEQALLWAWCQLLC